MSANGIAQLSTREARQAAKLELAAINRAADGNARPYYDITQLPTQFDGNDTVDNPNAGGLVVGRPWTSTPPYSAGVYKSIYYGGANAWTSNIAQPTFFDGKTANSASVATNFDNTFTAGEPNRAVQWIGYFLPSYTGVHTFSTGGSNVDDCLTLWIGATALAGYTTGNSVFNASLTAGTGTISLTAGTYYPIRVQHGNNSGPGSTTVYYAHTGQTITKVYTGKIFYNPATNGF